MDDQKGTATTRPERPLDVRPGQGVTFPPCLLLHDRETGLVLPGQVGGTIEYGLDRFARLTVEFAVDGDTISMGDHTQRHAEQQSWAAHVSQEQATLTGVSQAFASLSPDNQDRFRVMYDFATFNASAADELEELRAFVALVSNVRGKSATLAVVARGLRQTWGF